MARLRSHTSTLLSIQWHTQPSSSTIGECHAWLQKRCPCQYDALRCSPNLDIYASARPSAQCSRVVTAASTTASRTSALCTRAHRRLGASNTPLMVGCGPRTCSPAVPGQCSCRLVRCLAFTNYCMYPGYSGPQPTGFKVQISHIDMYVSWYRAARGPNAFASHADPPQ